jgi:ABC-type nitrate/sulfonate/bicarbonate transport system permease component
MISDGASRLIQIGFLMICLAAWAAVSANELVSPIFLPPFGVTMRELWTIVSQGVFWPDLVVTLTEWALAFALAATGGLIAGALVARSWFGVRVFDPLFSSLYSIPSILLFPLFVLFFGVGEGSKIAIGASIAFFPIVLSTIAGVSGVDQTLIKAAHSMGASPLRMFALVRVPAALPIILGGVRLGAILAFLAVVGTETIASAAGLGHQIVTYSDSMDTPKMFAYTLLVIVIAVALNYGVTAAEQRARRRLA